MRAYRLAQSTVSKSGIRRRLMVWPSQGLEGAADANAGIDSGGV
jgi:hypothetical protein